jgi:hypothetical protein
MDSGLVGSNGNITPIFRGASSDEFREAIKEIEKQKKERRMRQ